MRTTAMLSLILLPVAQARPPSSQPATQPAAPSTAQPAARPKPAQPKPEATVVSLRALDSAQAGRELHDLLLEARDDKPQAFVLRLPPTLAWRSDILRDALLDLKDCPVPTAVFIEPVDPKAHGRTSWGAVILGLACRHWGSADETLAVAVEHDEAARALAPEKTDWAAVDADLAELLASHTARREWLDGSAQVLLWPAEAWWTTTPVKGARAVVALSKGSEPAPADGVVVARINQRAAAGKPIPFQVALSTLAGSGGQRPRRAASWEEFCKAEGLTPPRSARGTTTSSIQDVREGVLQALDQIESRRRTSAAALEKAEKKDTPLQEASRVGAREHQLLRGTEAAISAVEALLARFPEVLRTQPPGTTPVGAKPASLAARWRALLQSHRDAFAKLQDRARALEDRKP